MGARDAALNIPSDSNSSEASEATPSLDVSEQPSFKRMDRSDSEDDEDRSTTNQNMSLISVEDSKWFCSPDALSILTLVIETQLQQQLFERRFSAVLPPRKS